MASPGYARTDFAEQAPDVYHPDASRSGRAEHTGRPAAEVRAGICADTEAHRRCRQCTASRACIHINTCDPTARSCPVKANGFMVYKTTGSGTNRHGLARLNVTPCIRLNRYLQPSVAVRDTSQLQSVFTLLAGNQSPSQPLQPSNPQLPDMTRGRMQGPAGACFDFMQQKIF